MYHSSSFSQFDIYKHSYEGHYFILSKLFLRKDYAIEKLVKQSQHSKAKQKLLLEAVIIAFTPPP